MANQGLRSAFALINNASWPPAECPITMERAMSMRKEGELTPRSENIRKGVHPNAFITWGPPLEFVFQQPHRLPPSLQRRLHQLKRVLLLPKPTVNEHDAGDALVLLEREGHRDVEVSVLPRLAPHCIRSTAMIQTEDMRLIMLVSYRGEGLTNPEA